jgi:L-fuculose-phosphate aldolase
MTGRAPAGEVVAAARGMRARGLSRGTAGNVSARVPEGMLITPSAVDYADMRPDDLVLMSLSGEIIDAAGRKPSTEWRLHATILAARPEVASVLHAHPPFCTALACLRRDIPPFHYMVAVAGGDSVRCAPYATFGTAALADAAVAALAGRTACLLANHGMVALGGSPAAALDLAAEVETLAEQYWRAAQLGEPLLLTDREMADALAAFADYRR